MKIVQDKGLITVDNTEQIKSDGTDILEISTSKDGKMWINVNGVSFMRFRPLKNKKDK